MISVIIPIYNPPPHVLTCVANILSQKVNVPFEIISVDSSTITTNFDNPQIKQIVSPKKLLPGIARNLGATSANGELLAFIDVDALLRPNALQEAWDFYKKGNLAFNGALIRHKDSKPVIGTLLEMCFFFNEFQACRPVATRKNLASTLLFVDRQVFLQHNGFKDIPRMQDTEFSERLASHRIPLKFTPLVQADYLQHTPLLATLKKIYIQGHNTRSIRSTALPNPINFKVFRVLATPFVMIFGGLKVLRIIARNIYYSSKLKELFINISLAPLLLLCSILWSSGYAKSLINNSSVLSNR